MTDFADIPATHPIPLPAPPSEPLEDAPTGPTKRGRVRWYHVAVLGLAVLLCAAAVGFSVMQSSERDDATHDRHVAQAELTDQRATTARAATRLATERREVQMLLEVCGRLVARDDIQELSLPRVVPRGLGGRHRAYRSYSYR